ncbi:MAG: GntR family transcriptional regulator [Ectothiorhodospiraceae bacterium]|nr:GntR family transcriptional regulator [Ectothiorhodospiraceae bacterium]MCH8504649.1 GntR family transcriptional regulator [Ectothiorhodospiraceae bacterium]
MKQAPSPTIQPVDSQPSRTSMQQRAVDAIRDLIVQGELPPGCRLQEQALSDYLGISRTPIREAFRALAAEGLVVIKPRRGAMVREMDLDELSDTFQVIASLDALAGELAAVHATGLEVERVASLHERMVESYQQGDMLEYFKLNQAIHRQIAASSRNPVLERQLQALNAQVQPYRFDINNVSENWRRSIADHEIMLEALRARDGARLHAVLRNHLPDKLFLLNKLRELRTSGRRRRIA